MTRGTRTKTSQLVNKFSVFPPDDNEFTGEGCTSLHTSRSQCQKRKCGDEGVDECLRDDERVGECIAVSETLFQSARIRHIKAERSTGLVLCGIRRRVHDVSGDGWRRLSAIMDSGSAECVAPASVALRRHVKDRRTTLQMEVSSRTNVKRL